MIVTSAPSKKMYVALSTLALRPGYGWQLYVLISINVPAVLG